MATKKKAHRSRSKEASRSAARRRAHARQPGAPTGAIPDRRDKRKPETLRLRSATPSFTVNDVARSVAYYQDVLGFHVKERWVHDGKLAGAELVAGAVTFYIGQDDWKRGRDRVKGEGFRVYCATSQDVDLLAARIRARGGTLLEDPEDRPWGTRDFAVLDPDGFKITFSTETSA